jgi:tape measure domain-containing protein
MFLQVPFELDPDSLAQANQTLDSLQERLLRVRVDFRSEGDELGGNAVRRPNPVPPNGGGFGVEQLKQIAKELDQQSRLIAELKTLIANPMTAGQLENILRALESIKAQIEQSGPDAADSQDKVASHLTALSNIADDARQDASRDAATLQQAIATLASSLEGSRQDLVRGSEDQSAKLSEVLQRLDSQNRLQNNQISILSRQVAASSGLAAQNSTAIGHLSALAKSGNTQAQQQSGTRQFQQNSLKDFAALLKESRQGIKESKQVVKAVEGAIKAVNSVGRSIRGTSISGIVEKVVKAPVLFADVAVSAAIKGSTTEIGKAFAKASRSLTREPSQRIANAIATNIPAGLQKTASRLGLENLNVDEKLNQFLGTIGDVDAAMVELAKISGQVGQAIAQGNPLDVLKSKISETTPQFFKDLRKIPEQMGNPKALSQNPAAERLKGLYARNMDLTDPVRQAFVGESAGKILKEEAPRTFVEEDLQALKDGQKLLIPLFANGSGKTQQLDDEELGRQAQIYLGGDNAPILSKTPYIEDETKNLAAKINDQIKKITGKEGPLPTGSTLVNSLVGSESGKDIAESVYQALKNNPDIKGEDIALVGHSSGAARATQAVATLDVLATELERQASEKTSQSVPSRKRKQGDDGEMVDVESKEDFQARQKAYEQEQKAAKELIRLSKELRAVRALGIGAAPYMQEVEQATNYASEYDSFVKGVQENKSYQNVDNALTQQHRMQSYFVNPEFSQKAGEELGYQPNFNAYNQRLFDEANAKAKAGLKEGTKRTKLDSLQQDKKLENRLMMPAELSNFSAQIKASQGMLDEGGNVDPMLAKHMQGAFQKISNRIEGMRKEDPEYANNSELTPLINAIDDASKYFDKYLGSIKEGGLGSARMRKYGSQKLQDKIQKASDYSDHYFNQGQFMQELGGSALPYPEVAYSRKGEVDKSGFAQFQARVTEVINEPHMAALSVIEDAQAAVDLVRGDLETVGSQLIQIPAIGARATNALYQQAPKTGLIGFLDVIKKRIEPKRIQAYQKTPDALPSQADLQMLAGGLDVVSAVGRPMLRAGSRALPPMLSGAKAVYGGLKGIENAALGMVPFGKQAKFLGQMVLPGAVLAGATHLPGAVGTGAKIVQAGVTGASEFIGSLGGAAAGSGFLAQHMPANPALATEGIEVLANGLKMGVHAAQVAGVKAVSAAITEVTTDAIAVAAKQILPDAAAGGLAIAAGKGLTRDKKIQGALSIHNPETYQSLNPIDVKGLSTSRLRELVNRTLGAKKGDNADNVTKGQSREDLLSTLESYTPQQIALLHSDSDRKRLGRQFSQKQRGLRGEIEEARKGGDVDTAHRLFAQAKSELMAAVSILSNSQFSSLNSQLKKIQPVNYQTAEGLDQDSGEQVRRFRASTNFATPSNRPTGSVDDFLEKLYREVGGQGSYKTVASVRWDERPAHPDAAGEFDPGDRGIRVSRETLQGILSGSREARGVIGHEMVHARQQEPGYRASQSTEIDELRAAIAMARDSLLLAKEAGQKVSARDAVAEIDAYQQENRLVHGPDWFRNKPQIANEGLEELYLSETQGLSGTNRRFAAKKDPIVDDFAQHINQIADTPLFETLSGLAEGFGVSEELVAGLNAGLEALSPQLRGIRLGGFFESLGGASAELFSFAGQMIVLKGAVGLLISSGRALDRAMAQNRQLLAVSDGQQSLSGVRQVAAAEGVSSNAYASILTPAIAATRGTANENVGKEIALSTAQAIRAKGLGAEQASNIQRAVVQIIGKGPQAEEVNQQLGDVMPTFISSLAKARGTSIGQVNKDLSNRQVTLEDINSAMKIDARSSGGIRPTIAGEQMALQERGAVIQEAAGVPGQAGELAFLRSLNALGAAIEPVAKILALAIPGAAIAAAGGLVKSAWAARIFASSLLNSALNIPIVKSAMSGFASSVMGAAKSTLLLAGASIAIAGFIEAANGASALNDGYKRLKADEQTRPALSGNSQPQQLQARNWFSPLIDWATKVGVKGTDEQILTQELKQLKADQKKAGVDAFNDNSQIYASTRGSALEFLNKSQYIADASDSVVPSSRKQADEVASMSDSINSARLQVSLASLKANQDPTAKNKDAVSAANKTYTDLMARRAVPMEGLENRRSTLEENLKTIKARANTDALEGKLLAPSIAKMETNLKALNLIIENANKAIAKSTQKRDQAIAVADLANARQDAEDRRAALKFQGQRQIARAASGQLGQSDTAILNQRISRDEQSGRQVSAQNRLRSANTALASVDPDSRSALEQITGKKLSLISSEEASQAEKELQRLGVEIDLSGVVRIIAAKDSANDQLTSSANAIADADAELQNVIFQKQIDLAAQIRQTTRAIEDNESTATRAQQDVVAAAKNLNLNGKLTQLRSQLTLATAQMNLAFAGSNDEFANSIGSMVSEWYQGFQSTLTTQTELALIRSKRDADIAGLQRQKVDFDRGQSRGQEDYYVQQQAFYGQKAVPNVKPQTSLVNSGRLNAAQNFLGARNERDLARAIATAIGEGKSGDTGSAMDSLVGMGNRYQSGKFGSLQNVMSAPQQVMAYHDHKVGQIQTLQDARARMGSKAVNNMLQSINNGGMQDSIQRLRGATDWRAEFTGRMQAGDYQRSRGDNYYLRPGTEASSLTPKQAQHVYHKGLKAIGNQAQPKNVTQSPQTFKNFSASVPQMRQYTLNTDPQEAAIRAEAQAQEAAIIAQQRVAKMNAEARIKTEGAKNRRDGARIQSQVQYEGERSQLQAQQSRVTTGDVFGQIRVSEQSRQLENSRAKTEKEIEIKFAEEGLTDLSERLKKATEIGMPEDGLKVIRDTIGNAQQNVGKLKLELANIGADFNAQDLRNKIQDALDSLTLQNLQGKLDAVSMVVDPLEGAMASVSRDNMSADIKFITARQKNAAEEKQILSNVSSLTGKEISTLTDAIAALKTEAEGSGEKADQARTFLEQINTLDIKKSYSSESEQSSQKSINNREAYKRAAATQTEGQSRVISAMGGALNNPYRDDLWASPLKKQIAIQENQAQLKQSLLWVDENQANLGVTAARELREQLTALSALSLQNTVAQLDGVRLGLKNTFQGSFKGFFNDLKEGNGILDSLGNLGKRISDGIFDQFSTILSDRMGAMLAQSLPGGDLTEKMGLGMTGKRGKKQSMPDALMGSVSQSVPTLGSLPTLAGQNTLTPLPTSLGSIISGFGESTTSEPLSALGAIPNLLTGQPIGDNPLGALGAIANVRIVEVAPGVSLGGGAGLPGQQGGKFEQFAQALGGTNFLGSSQAGEAPALTGIAGLFSGGQAAQSQSFGTTGGMGSFLSLLSGPASGGGAFAGGGLTSMMGPAGGPAGMGATAAMMTIPLVMSLISGKREKRKQKERDKKDDWITDPYWKPDSRKSSDTDWRAISAESARTNSAMRVAQSDRKAIPENLANKMYGNTTNNRVMNNTTIMARDWRSFQSSPAAQNAKTQQVQSKEFNRLG